MKKNTLILTLASSALALCASVGAFVSSETTTAKANTQPPQLTIAGQNLSFEDNIYILYAVSTKNLATTDDFGLLLWTEPQETYEYSTAKTKLVSNETKTIGGVEYPCFTYSELAAKQMTETVYTRAYAERDGVYYYSDVKKYSILEYAYNLLGKTEKTGTTVEDFKVLLNAMLAYGGAAQTYLKYNLDNLATADFTYVRVENAKFEDGFAYGLFKAGTPVKITPNEGFALGDTHADYYSVNENGEIILTVPEEKTIDESGSFEEKIDTTFLNAYNSTYGYEYFGEQENGEALQTLYMDIDEKVRDFHMDTETDLSEDMSIATISYSSLGISTDEAISVWKTYRDDNPLYYWLSNTLTYTVESLTLCADEAYALGATRETYNQLIYEKAENYASALNETDNAYQTALAYHDAIISAIDYAYDDNGAPESAAWAHNVLGVFSEEGGVCESYAKTFQLLLNYSGINNIFVTGDGNGESHAWNLVQLDDGNWYWCDLTWDDEGELGYTVTKNMGIYRTYFCVPDSSSFLNKHSCDTTSGANVNFLYALPARATTAYTDDTGLLLNSQFTADDCTFTIVGYNAVELNKTTKTGDWIIPETVDYNGVSYTVVSLGTEENYTIGSSLITSVTIPKSVRFIWQDALRLDGLKAITVDENNPWFTSQDGVLFTKHLYTLIQYPNGSSNTEYSIPDETVQIGSFAFDRFTLSSLTIGKNVQSFGIANWGNGYLITKPTVSIIQHAVNGQLLDIFKNLKGIKQLSIHEENAFYFQDENAIYNINRLVCITNLEMETYQIPTWLISYEGRSFSDLFADCTKLKSITVEEGNSYYTSIDGVLYSNNATDILLAPKNLSGEVTIPDSVTSIDKHAFNGCSSLTSITIPDSVTSIGIRAFEGCSSLTSITIPDSMTSINYAAFQNCSSLTNVTIPDSVTSIGNFVFSGCSSLTSITIPDGVTSIGDYTFWNCSNLTSITITDNVTSIGNSVFSGCSSLTSITIPNGVTSIGDSAFLNCSSLTSITIPDGVTSIAGYAFSYCSSLTSITIPDGVTSISVGAFKGCSSLTSITIPDGITSIGDYAFQNCSSLTSITIPDGVTSIGYSAFYVCSSLTNITIPDSVTSIGDYAFYVCSSLTSITIPDSVTSINKHAFNGCRSLTSITFEGTVEEWNAITKGENWNKNVPATEVVCKDGTVAL